MVRIESYLRRNDRSFLLFEEVESYDGDDISIPGAIVLTIDGVEVLTQELWTDVNWLWGYLIQAIDQCRQTGYGETGFPYQPIQLEARTMEQTDRLKVSVFAKGVVDNQAVGSADEIYQAVAEAGLAALDEFSRFVDSDNVPVYSKLREIIESWGVTA